MATHFTGTGAGPCRRTPRAPKRSPFQDKGMALMHGASRPHHAGSAHRPPLTGHWARAVRAPARPASHSPATQPFMNHRPSIGKVDVGHPPCWTCEHFVALVEGGSAFCVHGGELRVCAQAKGCAFHRTASDPPAQQPEAVSFCEAWRRVPRCIPRPPEVRDMLAADRRGQHAAPAPTAGWRNAEEHQWSRDPGRGRRYR